MYIINKANAKVNKNKRQNQRQKARHHKKFEKTKGENNYG